MSPITKSVLMRFIRAYVSGAVASMVVVMSFSGNSWSQLGTWLSALALAGIVGGITGVIMAADKLMRSSSLDIR